MTISILADDFAAELQGQSSFILLLYVTLEKGV